MEEQPLIFNEQLFIDVNNDIIKNKLKNKYIYARRKCINYKRTNMAECGNLLFECCRYLLDNNKPVYLDDYLFMLEIKDTADFIERFYKNTIYNSIKKINEKKLYENCQRLKEINDTYKIYYENKINKQTDCINNNVKI